MRFIENMKTDDPNKFGTNQIVDTLLWFFVKSWKSLMESKSIGIEILAVEIVFFFFIFSKMFYGWSFWISGLRVLRNIFWFACKYFFCAYFSDANTVTDPLASLPTCRDTFVTSTIRRSPSSVTYVIGVSVNKPTWTDT